MGASLPDGVSVIIPVYRSAEILPELTARLVTAMTALGRPFEVIFVVDGSPDGSWGVVQSLGSELDAIRAIAMMRNYGQHNALLCGIRAARYGTTVTMDDDLQHAPEELEGLLDALTPTVDVVYGAPKTETHGIFRDLASSVTKAVLRHAMGAETARNVSALRVFRTHLRGAFAAVEGPYVNIDVLLTWGTSRFTVRRVPHHPRLHGESNYTLGRLVRHALNMMTGFSTLPLRLASVVGFGFTVFGLSLLAYVFTNWLVRGSAVPGFAFLASVIVVFSGAQLFVLGIMGEYLARMHFRIMDKPPYVVAETYGFGDEAG